MIKFTGENKGSTNSRNGNGSAPPPGYRCTCSKCSFHDQFPELVGRPLSPQDFARIHPQPPYVPTDLGPEVAEAWTAVEVAQIAFAEADRVWEQALRLQSRERLKKGHVTWSPMVLAPNGNVVPNPTPAPTAGPSAADDAVEIAREAREEAGEKLRLATSRHSGLVRVWEQRQRDAEAEAKQAERLAAEQAEKDRKRSWLRGQLGK